MIKCLTNLFLSKWLFWPVEGMNWHRTGGSSLPNSGIWREVMGIVSDTLSWNTVSERSTVTPKSKRKRRGYCCLLAWGKAFLQGVWGRGSPLWWSNKQTATTGECKRWLLLHPYHRERKLISFWKCQITDIFWSHKIKFFLTFKFEFTFSVHGLQRGN